MSTAEWQALVVNKINEHDLFHGRLDGTTGKVIPVKEVHLDTVDPSKVAVLSWRWDGTHEMIGSRNIFCAIHQARELGIHFLFIDVISINQRLSGDCLLRQVVEFSQLYRNIQVIAAYDDKRVPGRFRETMYRPWILSEVRKFKHNPKRIVYVGHITENLGDSELVPPKPSVHDFYLHLNLSGINQRFTMTILAVLCGHYSMTSVSDLKYIIPSRAQLLQAAYSKMSRNDYLLTAAICCETGYKEDLFNLDSKLPEDFTDIVFHRYTVQVTFRSDLLTNADILLGGTHIGDWCEIGQDSAIFSIRTVANAIALIVETLGGGNFDEMYASDHTSEIVNTEHRYYQHVQAYPLDLPSLGISNDD